MSLLGTPHRSYGSVADPPAPDLHHHHHRRNNNNKKIAAYLAAVSVLAVVGMVAVVSYHGSSTNNIFFSSLLGVAPLAPPPAPAATEEIKKDRFEFVHSFGGYGQGGTIRNLEVAPPRVLVDAEPLQPPTPAGAAPASPPAPLPPLILQELAAFGVHCDGACTLPRAVMLLSALTEFGLNVQTGQSVSGSPLPPAPPPVSLAGGFPGGPTSKLLVIFIVDATMVGDVRVVSRQLPTEGGRITRVIVSGFAFDNGASQQATLDGVKGIIFSLRLRAVVIALVTDFGSRVETCDNMCSKLFSCHFADAVHPNYTTLTAPTTAEGPGRFTNFLSLEKMEILRWWYQMPPQLHHMPGLAWVVRRGYALEHPYYTYVPAVSWPDNQDDSYMEFLDITFSRDCDTMRHLFLHEKTHFYYSRIMTQQQKDAWDNLGGWTKDWNDVWGAMGTTTQFVSGYAASVDPNEDIAETVAEYILHPDLVRTRSIAKYNFLRDTMMNGYEYLPQFWPAATFVVQNTVAADDKYPNPIAGVKISVEGSEFEDKNVTAVLYLKEEHGWTSPLTATVDVGPPSGYSDASVTLKFVQDGNVLRAQAMIHKTEEYGFWKGDQIHIHDALGVTRWIHLDESNWRLYINNKYAQDNPLVYTPQSLAVTVDAAVDSDDKADPTRVVGVNGAVPRLQISFTYTGSHRPYYRWPAAARLVRRDAKQSYYVEGWGQCPQVWDESGVEKCSVTVLLSAYQEGDWYVAQVFMQESTGRSYREFFSTYEWDEQPTMFTVPGLGIDDSPPDINTASFTVKASPVNAAAPDGETVIEFSFEASDEQSGLAKWTYRLLDPSGVSHLQTIKIDSKTTTPTPTPTPTPTITKWQKLTGLITMPKGSPPGTWGVEEIEVWDAAGNRADLRMVDTRVFVPLASVPQSAGVGDVNVGLLMNSGDGNNPAGDAGGGDGEVQQ